jgi:hypothetical protein
MSFQIAQNEFTPVRSHSISASYNTAIRSLDMTCCMVCDRPAQPGELSVEAFKMKMRKHVNPFHVKAR